MDEASKLAEDHWQWLKEFLDTIDYFSNKELKTIEYVYKTAMAH
jgi:hypothetical protein